jgi:DNA invertase Pin-like site-specific DNA recombinase
VCFPPSFPPFQARSEPGYEGSHLHQVSTADQNPELQLRELQEYASRQDWEVIEIYQDVVSGAKASRPGLNRPMEDAAARKFEILLVWKLDRFGRSLVDCLNNIQELQRHRVRFIAVTQNLDTDQQNPADFCSTCWERQPSLNDR